MSFVAGRTERLRIVSSVMIVPHRNPVFNAKALATIDVLSGGRLTVGIGVGWMEEEFRALACRRFQAPRRGDRRVCRHLQEALDRRAGEP